MRADVSPEIEFLAYASGLATVERYTRSPVDFARGENSAEHSWHVGLCAMTLAPVYAPGVDLGRVLRMLAIHDLVEIEVGDVPLHEQQARAAIEPAEREAAEQIFGRIEGGEEMHDLWQEFEDLGSDEARFARAVDRTQPLILNWATGGRSWRERGLKRDRFDHVLGLIEGYWQPLHPPALAIIDAAESAGCFGFPADRHPPRADP